MASGRLLRQLFRSVAVNDESSFRSVAEQIINNEREKHHHLLANDLQKILSESSARYAGDSIPSPTVRPSEIPKDQERGLPLLEVRLPSRFLSDLVLSDYNRSAFDQVILEQDRGDVLRSHGLKPLSRLLFCGPPGCGKSIGAEVIASELRLELVMVRFDAVVSSFLGETAANLRKVFDFIEQRRYLVFFDEIDAIAKERSDSAEHGELKRVVNSFLQQIDGYRGTSVIVAATNHEGMLDSALWRRFDEILRFERPNTEQISRLLHIKLQSVRYDLPLESREFLNRLEGLSHAEIERLIINAIKSAILKGREVLTRDIFDDAHEKELERLRVIKKALS